MPHHPDPDERVLRQLAAALAADDPTLARRLRQGPQRPLHRARVGALAGAAVAACSLFMGAAAGILNVAIPASVVGAVLALFAASVSVLLYVSEAEASARLSY